MIKLVLPASRKPVNKYTGTSIFCSELKSENLLYFIVIDTCTNYTESADNTGCAVSYVRLCGYIIKVDPLTVCALNYTLCTKDHAVGIILGECLENRVYTFNSKLLGSLTTKAGEDLVSVVMVVIVTMTSTRTMLTVFVVVVVVIVIMAMALFIVVMMLVLVAVALLIVMVMMLVFVAVALFIVVVMLVFVAVALFIVVVMMLVIVTAALLIVVMMVFVLVAAALFIVVMMLVLVAAALLIVVVMMLVIVAAALLIVMVVMVVLMLLLKSLKRRIKSILLLHSGENVLAVELIPRSGYDSCGSVVLSDKLNCAFNLL